jgi:acetolactate synthase-1/2/3 large subunit
MRVADYLFQRLADLGIRHAFLVTGGGAMHLNDALAREKRIAWICNHHEQACSMAAEGYARVTGRPAVVNVTTGPGGINALNGVFGAFTDSIPMVVVSGQVKRETCLSTYSGLGDRLRQLGDQEVDIVRMAAGVTKSAVQLVDPQLVRWEIERAYYLAVSGRPGPVWIDVPVDVQGAQVDPRTLVPYAPEPVPGLDEGGLEVDVRRLIARMADSRRPVLMVGTGVRIAGAADRLLAVAERLGIPVVTAFTAHDLLPSDHPLHAGRPGTVGDRAGNLAVQNSDLLLVVGSRLPLRQVGYNWKTFARHAFKVQVDIDAAELAKPIAPPDWGIHCDAACFLAALERGLNAAGWDAGRHRDWLAWCRARVARYPAVTPRMREWNGRINPYVAIDALVRMLRDDDVIVCGNATACVVTYQVAWLRRGMRLFSNAGSASMGYDLPAAIGAAVAHGGRRVVCLAGDGSLQMNIQELQTVITNRLPVKIVVIDNGGYLSIRGTQSGFFGLLVGESPASGVEFPDYARVGAAYGLPSSRIEEQEFVDPLRRFLDAPGAGLVHLVVDPTQAFEPKASSRRLPDGSMVSAPLEDLAPFLPRDELRDNLLVPGLDG